MATSEKRGKEKVVKFCVPEFHCLATILKMNGVAEHFSCELAPLVAWKATSLFSLLFVFYLTKIYRICRVWRGGFLWPVSVFEQIGLPTCGVRPPWLFIFNSESAAASFFTLSLRCCATPLCHFHPRYFELKKGGWKKAPWAASLREFGEREKKKKVTAAAHKSLWYRRQK